MKIMELSLAVKFAILSSGIFLWIGMCTGVWKYAAIRSSPQFRAHYYIDISHRASLLYAPACLILAVLAYFSTWSATTNLLCVIANLVFFFASVLSYIIHGILKDTNNQFRKPHQVAKWTLPSILMTLFMLALIVAEVGATLVLCLGTAKFLFG
ncbi:MAG: hypothetical protein E6Q25_02335 [Acinetobacter sp.]|nr:MAG: hypothetical protein E6Q25_02335 [Acinetobacter sp.]